MSPRNEKRTRYRRGVGALLINRDGLVLVCQRADKDDPAWQLPQGGIDGGEKPRRAVMRELAEEIGTADAEILAETPDWLRYDFPDEVTSPYRGQRQKWFALRFRGGDSDIDLGATDHPEFRDWKWVPIDALPDLVVAFKRPVYRALVDLFAPFARPVDDPSP